jgi:phage shock protein A
MAYEPENLVLELLRNMRQEFHDVHEDIRDIKKGQDVLALNVAGLDERLEMLRESTMTALGFATDTGVRQKKLEKQVSELAKRVEQLEKSK